MSEIVLVGDIGGTHDNLAVVELSEDSMTIQAKEKRFTKEHTVFYKVVTDFLDTIADPISRDVSRACIAVAGPVKDGEVEMPHTDLVIDADRLRKQTRLDEVTIINDFDAIGYAINIIEEDDFIRVQEGKTCPASPKALVGAGTGLGKNLLIYDEHVDQYIPHSSEGGHADFPVTSKKELELASMIQEVHGKTSPVEYEDVLSGKGLENIHRFICSEHTGEEELSAKEIAETTNTLECSQATFDWFITFYARCCRNYALDVMPRNGLYIAGGIAAKNTEAFDERFTKAFTNAAPQFKDLLSEIPISVITNYEISLKGAAHALRIKN